MDFVTVISTTPNGVALWEKHPDHPAGEAYVTGDMVAKVANTPLVDRLLSNGRLGLVVDGAPTPPWSGYDEASVESIVKRMATAGDIEQIVVRQYEAAHKGRKLVLTAQPEPVAGYDAMNATDVLALLPTLTDEQRAAVAGYEPEHKNRKTVIDALQSA